MIPKPEIKQRTIIKEYWSCGMDCDGHYHQTQEAAEACINRRFREIKPKRTRLEYKTELRIRRAKNIETAYSMRMSGSTYREIGLELGLSGTAAMSFYRIGYRLKNKITGVSKEGPEDAYLEIHKHMMDIPIELLISGFGLSDRTIKILNNKNISSVGELVVMTDQDLLRTKNAGRKTLYEIREAIENFRVKLLTDENKNKGIKK